MAVPKAASQTPNARLGQARPRMMAPLRSPRFAASKIRANPSPDPPPYKE
jgi:hypothetical protein